MGFCDRRTLVTALHPMLLCAFIVARSDEATIYREGTFVLEPCIADWEAPTPQAGAIRSCWPHGGPHPFPITWKE